MKKKLVVVAMSGGVDSTYAAYLLKKQGYQVIGMMAKFWSEPCESGQARDNLCCTPESVAVAHRNAKKLGIDFIVVDLSKEFKQKVVDYYISEYKNCRTPNPCIVCNKEIKFGLLAEKAKALGADYFVTGHYAKIKQDSQDERFYIEKAKDETKDQSYFLWAISQENLPMILFPLGDYNKQEVVAHVKKLKLEIQSKESQDICFVSSGSSQNFLKRYIQNKPGIITDSKGIDLGQHAGLYNYTVGQRHGLQIASPSPTYVLELDCQGNRLIVGKKEDLQRDSFEIENAQWFVDGVENIDGISVKIRYRADEISCTLRGNLVKLKEPAAAITPGQSAVFYKEEKLIGGGIISR